MQLLIPYARVNTAACDQALANLQLPRLDRLLRRLALVDAEQGSEHDLTPPHERVLARALGLPAHDGRIPWAAHALAQSGTSPGDRAWAWITPAHWDVGADRIVMADPHALQLHEAESRALMAAMAPYFAQDGIVLDYREPGRWLARGEPLDTLASASLDRVIGADIGAWMPAAAILRRLQNEMQMLLYTHPVNDARAARAMPSVNSFWVSGSGRLGANWQPAASAAPRVADALRLPALRGDWAAWAQAWQQVDQTDCRDLLSELASGRDVQLVLCSPRTALRFTSAASGWRDRLQRRLRRTGLHTFKDHL